MTTTRRVAATTTDVDRLAPTRVEVYNVATGRADDRLITADVSGLAFDDDGDRLATSGAEGGAIVWDLGTGEPIHTLVGEAVRSPRSRSTPTPRGSRRPASTGHCASGTSNAGSSWSPPASRVRSPSTSAFSPDGSRLITADEDGAVRQWMLDLDDLLAIADDRVTRDLTDDECRQYLHIDGCPAR